jgi:hypothetical protein
MTGASTAANNPLSSIWNPPTISGLVRNARYTNKRVRAPELPATERSQRGGYAASTFGMLGNAREATITTLEHVRADANGRRCVVIHASE